ARIGGPRRAGLLAPRIFACHGGRTAAIVVSHRFSSLSAPRFGRVPACEPDAILRWLSRSRVRGSLRRVATFGSKRSFLSREARTVAWRSSVGGSRAAGSTVGPNGVRPVFLVGSGRCSRRGPAGDA